MEVNHIKLMPSSQFKDEIGHLEDDITYTKGKEAFDTGWYKIDNWRRATLVKGGGNIYRLLKRIAQREVSLANARCGAALNASFCAMNPFLSYREPNFAEVNKWDKRWYEYQTEKEIASKALQIVELVEDRAILEAAHKI